MSWFVNRISQRVVHNQQRPEGGWTREAKRQSLKSYTRHGDIDARRRYEARSRQLGWAGSLASHIRKAQSERQQFETESFVIELKTTAT